MAEPEPDRRAPDYRMARIGAAGALIGTLMFVLVLDAISPEYEASVIIVAGLLGAMATLLGVELKDPRT